MKKIFSFNPFAGRVIHLNPPQIVALSYLVLLFLGTLLLKIPLATNEKLTWLDSLFTATSAVTVTGLVVVDTGNHFTPFGQFVIMTLIQLGGLGLMTFAVLAVIVLGKKIGLHQRLIVREAFNQTSLGGVIRLVKSILVFTFIIELIAFICLSITWVPDLGFWKGLYVSLFHTISHLIMQVFPCGRIVFQHMLGIHL